MFSTSVLYTFIIYFIFLFGIGIYFYRKTNDLDDYLIGGKRMGPWVTALSAQASDMSGWLLMGLPGVVYLSGLFNAWVSVGLFIGTVINWVLVAPRLKKLCDQYEVLTIPAFIQKRFGDEKGVLLLVTAVVTLLFFTIYAASGLVGAGKLFQEVLGLDYKLAVCIGGAVILLYTFLGGFFAVCWTDLFQGLLMIFAIVISVALALTKIDIDLQFSKMVPVGGEGWIALVSSLAWGLGYFGQPHILVRFIGIRSAGELKISTKIALGWVLISLMGAMLIGVIGAEVFPNIPKGDHEKVFIYLINRIFPPVLSGVFLAAILSAIMSTIDSQLLVSSSALTEDLYSRFFKKTQSVKAKMLLGRLSVIVIFAIAFVLALNPESTILDLVAYAWAGLGASLGPVILAGVVLKRVSLSRAVWGIIIAAVVVIVWKNMGIPLYELFPAFVVNFAIQFIPSLVVLKK